VVGATLIATKSLSNLAVPSCITAFEFSEVLAHVAISEVATPSVRSLVSLLNALQLLLFPLL
jgi:hypothetical protein